MSIFFATVFPDAAVARQAQVLVEKLDHEQSFKVVASVVIAKGPDGEVTQHHGHTPGARGAGLGAVVGGVLGLVAGPFGAMLGAAGGALSGGWFDLLRVEEREYFQREVARHIQGDEAALLGQVLNLSEEAKADVERQLTELGGTIVCQ